MTSQITLLMTNVKLDCICADDIFCPPSLKHLQERTKSAERGLSRQKNIGPFVSDMEKTNFFRFSNDQKKCAEILLYVSSAVVLQFSRFIGPLKESVSQCI